VDYSAARAVIALKKNLTEAGIELAFARLPGDLRSEFDRRYLTETIGPARIFNRLHDAIAAFEEQAKALEREISEPVSDGGVQNSVRKVDG
jgi:sulfate permease, SulP family